MNGEKETVWIRCRLDRAFAEWFRLFPQVQSEYLAKVESDHRPMLTKLIADSNGKKGRFWLDKRWCSKPETFSVIQRGWNKFPNNTIGVSWIGLRILENSCQDGREDQI